MTADALTEDAIEYMHAGNWDEATRRLEQVLATNTEDARALRLLGTVHHMSGRHDEAARLLEASLAVDPDAQSAWLNLTSIELARARPEAALAAARSALAIDERSADALFNLGVALQANDLPGEARTTYERLLEQQPGSPDVLVNLAALSLLESDWREAARQARAALAIDASHLRAHLCAARALAAIGDVDGAGKHVDAASRLTGADPAVDAERAELLIATQRLGAAEALLRDSLSTSPGDPAVWERLARVLIAAGRNAEAAEHLAEAVDWFPDSAALARFHAQALDATGEPARALAALRHAISLAPDDPSGHLMLGELLLEAPEGGALDEADAAFVRTIELAPLLAPAHDGRVRIALLRGDPSAALATCDRYLADNPNERTLLAARGMTLFEVGERERAQSLLDHERLIWSEQIEPPPGFDGLDAFNAALEAHARAHPSLTDSPSGHATRHGHHTGDLLNGDRGPFAEFERVLRSAATRYGLRPIDHPYLERRPQMERIVCWAVLMRRGGHQTAHIHPAAWLSGVYYARLPDAVRDDATDGWLEFGAPPDGRYALHGELPRHLVRPRAGLLTLFPSYFYHRTLPYDTDEERLSIAFDLLPVVSSAPFVGGST